MTERVFLFCCAVALGWPAAAKITVHDYVKPLLEDYKKIKRGTKREHKDLILAYEFINGNELSSAFFSSADPQRRKRALNSLDQYAEDLPRLTKKYEKKVPEIISILDVTEKKFSEVFGHELNAHIFLFSTLAPTDAIAQGPKPEAFSLNLRLVAEYTKEELEILISHELFHLLQGKLQAGEPDPNPIDGGVFAEGWATYASSLVFPGKPDWKYVSYFKKSDAQYKKFELNRAEIIDSMLLDWEKKDGISARKYFSGNPQDSFPWEPRNGYYVGYLAAKHMAEKTGAKETAVMKYSKYRQNIKDVLKILKGNN